MLTSTQVGYVTADNATNNDTMMDQLATLLLAKGGDPAFVARQ